MCRPTRASLARSRRRGVSGAGRVAGWVAELLACGITHLAAAAPTAARARPPPPRPAGKCGHCFMIKAGYCALTCGYCGAKNLTAAPCTEDDAATESASDPANGAAGGASHAVGWVAGARYCCWSHTAWRMPLHVDVGLGHRQSEACLPRASSCAENPAPGAAGNSTANSTAPACTTVELALEDDKNSTAAAKVGRRMAHAWALPMAWAPSWRSTQLH